MSTRTIRLLTDDLSAIELANAPVSSAGICSYGLADQASFTRQIVVERKRTERSARPFLLMLIEGRESLRPVNGTREFLQRLVFSLKNSTRETDSTGWYEHERTIGVIFTEVGDADESVMSAILTKVANGLRTQLSAEQMARLEISLYRYPDGDQPPQQLDHLALYPDLQSRSAGKTVGQILKRALDILASALLLVLLSPVFLAVALAIKLNSKGPVLFKQKRVGQYGLPFTFLKFRSMYVNSDPQVHQKFVTWLINRDAEQGPRKIEKGGVYKLQNDRRITRVGRILRRTSLDELPQLWNVLRGEMSLVGPRPAIPYELAAYQPWHRRRMLQAKPGITGLWQVTGRSRVRFDDMVRMDLRYAMGWSPWLDIKILLRTPLAVFRGTGAY